MDMHLAAEIEAAYVNRKLNLMWLAKHCKALDCRQEVRITG